MRARMVIPTLLCFWMVFVTFAYCEDESEKEKVAAEAATLWLALVVSGQYGESWFQSASLFRNAGVEEAIEARGARVFFLPAYSPDFNPIEQLFSGLKSFLRKTKARTVDELWRAISSFIKGVSKEHCKAYLANSGYT